MVTGFKYLGLEKIFLGNLYSLFTVMSVVRCMLSVAFFFLPFYLKRELDLFPDRH